jgi:hypothetical protein
MRGVKHGDIEIITGLGEAAHAHHKKAPKKHGRHRTAKPKRGKRSTKG